MKKVILDLYLVFFFIAIQAQPHPAEGELTYRKGELLVLLHQAANVNELVGQNQSAGFKVIKRLSPDMNLWLIAYDAEKIKGEDAKALIAANKSVQIVQFNHSNAVYKTNTPNDSLYSYQWDMDIISATQAWAIDTGGFTTNGTPIVIASIDGGFDITHPDLNVWHNAYEIPGNGIDDDGNGYIDDYHGWNTMTSNDSVPIGNGHGTATMGISSAHGNNTIGIAGVNWNVQAMAIATDIYDESNVIAAYSYVFAQRKMYNETNGAKGAFIVSSNSSFGPSGYGYQYPLWNAMYDSMGSVGILSAGATSNDPNCDVDTCPDIPSQCASRYTVITTGTNSADTRHGGYGPINVDIAAPGNGSYTIVNGGGYSGFGGTSAASPHIAGAIALMWSAACPKMLEDYKLYPDSIAMLMKNYLLTGVDSLPALVGMIASGGRLNIYKALTNVQTYDCTIPTSGINETSDADAINIFPNPANASATIRSTYPIKSIKMYDYLGQQMNVLIQNNVISLSGMADGIYTVEVSSQNGNTAIKKLIKQ